MIEIRGDEYLFTTTQSTEWDANMNNHCGGNKVVIRIEPTNVLLAMQNDVENLKIDLTRLQQEKDAEVLLRNSNPTLKDAYEKYQTVYKLMKQTMDAIEGADGG